MSGNRTRGVCVIGRNVTNNTNTDMLTVKKPHTFLILRAPIFKDTKQTQVSSDDHTAMDRLHPI